MSRDEHFTPRTQVLQDVLDDEIRRQTWAQADESPFGEQPVDEDSPDDAADLEAPPAPDSLAFHDLFGLIPGSETDPLRLNGRRKVA